MSDLTNAIKKCVVLNSDVPEEWKIWTNKDDFENKSKTGKKSIPKYLLSDLGQIPLIDDLEQKRSKLKEEI